MRIGQIQNNSHNKTTSKEQRSSLDMIFTHVMNTQIRQFHVFNNESSFGTAQRKHRPALWPSSIKK